MDHDIPRWVGAWIKLLVSPVIGHFIIAHLKINDDAEAHNTPARDVGLERQAPSIAVLERGKGKARLTLN